MLWVSEPVCFGPCESGSPKLYVSPLLFLTLQLGPGPPPHVYEQDFMAHSSFGVYYQGGHYEILLAGHRLAIPI